MKRYIFKVKYRDKVIDKISISLPIIDGYDPIINDNSAEDEANIFALENFRVELEEEIEEE